MSESYVITSLSDLYGGTNQERILVSANPTAGSAVGQQHQTFQLVPATNTLPKAGGNHPQFINSNSSVPPPEQYQVISLPNNNQHQIISPNNNNDFITYNHQNNPTNQKQPNKWKDIKKTPKVKYHEAPKSLVVAGSSPNGNGEPFIIQNQQLLQTPDGNYQIVNNGNGGPTLQQNQTNQMYVTQASGNNQQGSMYYNGMPSETRIKNRKQNKHHNYNDGDFRLSYTRHIFRLGICAIIFGFGLFICGICAVALFGTLEENEVSSGIWGGFIIMACGAIAIVASLRPMSRMWTILLLTLSILSLCVCLGGLILFALNIEYFDACVRDTLVTYTGTDYTVTDKQCPEDKDGGLATYSLMVIFICLQLVISIALIILCILAFRCCDGGFDWCDTKSSDKYKYNGSNHPSAYHNQQHQQQNMVMMDGGNNQTVPAGSQVYYIVSPDSTANQQGDKDGGTPLNQPTIIQQAIPMNQQTTAPNQIVQAQPNQQFQVIQETGNNQQQIKLIPLNQHNNTTFDRQEPINTFQTVNLAPSNQSNFQQVTSNNQSNSIPQVQSIHAKAGELVDQVSSHIQQSNTQRGTRATNQQPSSSTTQQVLQAVPMDMINHKFQQAAKKNAASLQQPMQFIAS